MNEIDGFFDDLFRDCRARDVFDALINDVRRCDPGEVAGKSESLGMFLRDFDAKAEAARQRNAAKAA